MFKAYLFTILLISALLLDSCNRKQHPGQTPLAPAEDNNVVVEKKSDSLLVKKAVLKPRKKEPVPKVIVVNDKAAHKSVDGRFYYDLEGHRYWKNYKDGKYYLFNKSMYTNDAFKSPGK